MPFIGNQPATGENNSFKLLDNISSYTWTFDGSNASIVSVANDTLTQNAHRFITGQRVTYTDGGGSTIGGLSSGSVYYIVKNDQNTIKLAPSYADAIASNTINFTSLGTGTTHTLNVAFDGVNTKFKATHSNGVKAQITRAAQLMISVNGVIQQPFDTSSPTSGFGFDLDSVIIFSDAPAATDVFWGNIIANNFPTFDISDNKVDNFTGNGVSTDFALSRSVANNENVLVTIDGVVQYPSDTGSTRSYTVYDNVISFSEAPPDASIIQVRHIGFAGATTSAVTGFYGRSGNVGLRTGDNISVGDVKSIGIGSFASINVTGIITATSFSGSGSALTGVNTNFVSAIGIQSAGLQIGVGITQLNFVGTGNTFKVNGTTVDISIQGGGGGGTGVSSTGILTCRGIANSAVIMDSLTLDDYYVQGTNYAMIGPIEVSVGATITVGAGVSYVVI